MTDTGGQPAVPSREIHGKDSWDMVLAQLRRRPSVRVALVLLALLYGAAIYAPFLAGDRPLRIRATDAAGYRKAQKLLLPIATNIRGLAVAGAPGFHPPASKAGEPARRFDEALAAEESALRQKAAAMAEQLSEPDAALLRELLAALDETIRAAQAGAAPAAQAGDAAGAQPAVAAVVQAAGDRLVELAKRAKAELSPAQAGVTPEPAATVALHERTLWPAFAAISRVELYFMGLWLLVLGWPLWNAAVNRWLLRGDREAIRRARRRKALCLALLPLLPLPLWRGGEDPFATSPYKAGLASGDIVASSVLFPPVPFGLAEQNDTEFYRPPTWHRSAEVDEAGRRVHGPPAESHADFLVTSTPVEVRAAEPARNAAARHPLGTDTLGRDILTRMIWGGRVSLTVGLVSTLFLVLIGIVVGALAGYYGGRVDLVISRVIEIFQCFPPFFLILIVVVFLGPSILNIMLMLGLTRWTGVARLVRGEFLRLRGLDFVVASEALGVRQRRTIFRHILPNAMGPVLVAATFSVASGILTESALSFLGFGVLAPVPSWGSLLTENRSPEFWWIQIFPGLMIFLTVTLYNLLGEGVSDALDPRQKV
ncbi:MAG TPA: ABC transporter permease [Planctomycetota bacterium]|nr:ABC transporter permease [Planctomycetota bacterium]